TRAEMLEAILAPSRVVPPAYRAVDAFLRDGGVVSGVAVEDGPDRLTLVGSDGVRAEVDPADVEERRPSPLSTMPEGLLDALTLEEIVDLLRFLEEDVARPAPERSEWRRIFDGRSLEGWTYDPALWRVEDG